MRLTKWLFYLALFLLLGGEATALPAGALGPAKKGPASLPPVLFAQTPPSPNAYSAYRGLHAAASKGDIAAIKRLAVGGADLNSKDPHGRTPLMVAAYRRNKKAARILIKAGADLHALDSEQYDLLTIASVLNDIEMVRLALASGANAKLITSPYQGTALIAAAHLGHVEVVQALIDAKAPLDHINNLGWTALIEAIVLGDGGPRHEAIVRALLKAGARPDLPDSAGTTPLQLAEQRGYSNMFRILQSAGGRR